MEDLAGAAPITPTGTDVGREHVVGSGMLMNYSVSSSGMTAAAVSFASLNAMTVIRVIANPTG